MDAEGALEGLEAKPEVLSLWFCDEADPSCPLKGEGIWEEPSLQHKLMKASESPWGAGKCLGVLLGPSRGGESRMGKAERPGEGSRR